MSPERLELADRELASLGKPKARNNHGNHSTVTKPLPNKTVPKTPPDEESPKELGSAERAVISELLALAELMESSARASIRELCAHVVLIRIDAILNQDSAVRSYSDEEVDQAVERLFQKRAEAPGLNVIDAIDKFRTQLQVILDKNKTLIGSDSRHGDLQVIRSAAKMMIDHVDTMLEHEESV